MRTSVPVHVGGAMALAALLSARPAIGVEALVSPKHDERVITVGGPNADVSGFTSKAIQIAVDALKTQGGGTVRLNAGTYRMVAPVKLYSRIHLVGAGHGTVLRKVDGFKTKFAMDVDWKMLKALVEDASGFEVGMGILISDRKHGGSRGTVARITSIDGNTVYFDSNSRFDYTVDDNGTMTNTCSVIEAVGVEDVKIEDISVDGNKTTTSWMNGCLGGGVYLHKARNCLVERVRVSDFRGDGFSWQTTENVTVRDCEAFDCAGLGLHPGMGTDSTLVEGCRSHHNGGDGLYVCWRVQHGTFRENALYANRRHGISIGHQDTDNVFEKNHIYENGRHGVHFRNEKESNGAHRNTFRNNTIENNGMSAEAYGFHIGGATHDITIVNNTIRSTGKGRQRFAVCIGPNAARIRVDGNRISGCERIRKDAPPSGE